MQAVRIVTDSSCDLSQAEAERYGVEIVPLSIRFGSDEYTDRVDLSVEDFYKKMAAADDLPETAAPSPGAFEGAFRAAKEAGATSVICLNISSDLSATMQSALTAAKPAVPTAEDPNPEPRIGDELDIRVVDSKSITSGLGTLVIAAAEAAEAGQSADEVVALLDDLIPRTHVYGALNTLANLKKGGRIGGAQAMLGSMLSIKPIVDISTGVVEEAGKQRTRKKSLVWLYDKMKAAGAIERVAVYHGDAPDLDEFLDLIAPTFPRDSVRIGKIGAVIGTHGGPEIMGVTWIAAR
jgi:DegV family protein with EDD domain